ncbi:DUF4395 family protein [Sulfurovum sp. zt1-1]|uniref:DUF4395 family protein n=1 Tax=Sulfurovum zhangzhouensis TaxID=3019067 RepID=A0ABT7R0Y9_9BACT|nr:DUF4395 family protein [Sulfurovum zhangzhouensis]MDM5272764.1 DUF4395 family protein [Sulfurovum zhangzhouensis]
MIDGSKTRIVAALQATLLGSYLFTGYVDLLYILVYDFFVRLYLTSLLSPLELIAIGVESLFTREKHSGNRLDKEFATHIALTIVSLSLTAGLLEYPKIAFTFTLALVIWKILEATTNICLGCKLYERLQRKGINIISL